MNKNNLKNEEILIIKNFIHKLKNGYFCPKDCFECYDKIGGLSLECDTIAKFLYEHNFQIKGV